jgi:hypothetical protein
MPDLSAALPTTDLEEAFLSRVDVEGKLTAALEDLGPVSGRDVVLLDAGRGFRERQLAEIGARVTAVSFPDPANEVDVLARLAELPAGDADAVVASWSELATPGSRFITAAESLLRPGGRLLLVHDYGRDDVWNLLPDRRERLVEWSQRRGPFLGAGFRVRVIHCWWTFESVEEARELLVAGFGDLGAAVADTMRRPRLEYQVAIYHRSAGVADAAADAAAAAPVEVAGGAG